MIFREYDIRGIVDKDLTEEIAENIGKAIGSHIQDDIVVGRDVRLSSERIKNALIHGILSAGCDVVDVGIVTTPILYFSAINYKKRGGVMVTASHNPKQYNGFKIWKDGNTIYGKEIQLLREMIEKKDFIKGNGKLSLSDPTDAYINCLKSKISLKKKLKVVIDAGNGTAGFIAPRLLRELGCEIVELYCEPDGNFPNHIPDPTVQDYLKDLIMLVKKTNADLGIGFDGDSDRIGVVDDKGDIVWGDMLVILYARDILKKTKTKVIFDVKCSLALKEEILKYGGIPIMWKTGHSLIKDKLKKEGALLAGEMSGHIIFADNYFGYDDAIFACCRLLEILSQTDKKLSEIEIPYYYSSSEIRMHCPDEKKFSIVENLKNYFKERYNIIDIDGVRVEFDDGWGLVRASNTEPALVLRFEAKTKERMDEIRSLIENKLNEIIKEV